MYRESKAETIKGVMKFIIIFVAAFIIFPLLFAVVLGGLNSKSNPIKCVTDYDGQSYCKHGNGDWMPQWELLWATGLKIEKQT